MSLWTLLSERITIAVGRPFRVRAQHRVSGGCINNAYHLVGDDGDYFVKLNDVRRLPMFEAEAMGLVEIAATATVRVPKPICWGSLGERSYLVLDYLSLRQAPDETLETLGRQLALLHRVSRPYFGWHRDNTIGSTPQLNTPSADWIDFWCKHRLGFQLDLAARNGYRGSLQHKGERLLLRFHGLFTGYMPSPSLVHGDLWSGNVASDGNGCPVIFDPALYYGDRETDMAVTELFGGFPPRFYSAYQEIYPVDSGFRTRRTLYNLYHILNHLNLFGAGYRTQAEDMLDCLLATLG